MNTFKYTDQEHERVIQQLHEIANEHKCDFDYDDILLSERYPCWITPDEWEMIDAERALEDD